MYYEDGISFNKQHTDVKGGANADFEGLATLQAAPKRMREEKWLLCCQNVNERVCP